jgi:succinate dehydrogenase/fumarate reductase flavoprotein subunit
MTVDSESSKDRKNAISRRNFIAGTVAGAAALGAVAGATTLLPHVAATPAAAGLKAQPAGIPSGWDYTTDVVVVGYGGAGAVTAITAYDAGAQVLVLEKAPIEGGGNSRMSGGFISYCKPENVQAAAMDLYTACWGLTPMDICEAWANQIALTPAWLTKMGILYSDLSAMGMPGGGSIGGSDFANFPGAASTSSVDMTDKTNAFNAGGGIFFNWANGALASRGIQILFNTRANALVQDPNTGEILGVMAQDQGTIDKTIAIKANKAVVLCTGGMEYNEEMKDNYLRPYPIRGVGWMYNTGDGVKMAQAVGADLWHMNLVCSAGTTFVSPASPIGWWGMSFSNGSDIYVNRKGNRFMCENPLFNGGNGGTDAHRAFMGFGGWDFSDTQKDGRYLNVPFYLVFDEIFRKAGPLYSLTTIGNGVLPPELGGITTPWSKDNSAEIAAGWITTGADIPTLAANLGQGMDLDGYNTDIDATQLEATITNWNAMCTAGVDTQYGRVISAANAIVTPPYYAIVQYPSLYSTNGGPRKNAQAQILDTNGNPIPRLYEAGSLGHTCANVYSLFGQNWAEIMAFGRIAGANAAAETNWTS